MKAIPEKRLDENLDDNLELRIERSPLFITSEGYIIKWKGNKLVFAERSKDRKFNAGDEIPRGLNFERISDLARRGYYWML